jgi:hypothetical protein
MRISSDFVSADGPEHYATRDLQHVKGLCCKARLAGAATPQVGLLDSTEPEYSNSLYLEIYSISQNRAVLVFRPLYT